MINMLNYYEIICNDVPVGRYNDLEDAIYDFEYLQNDSPNLYYYIAHITIEHIYKEDLPKYKEE